MLFKRCGKANVFNICEKRLHDQRLCFLMLFALPFDFLSSKGVLQLACSIFVKVCLNVEVHVLQRCSCGSDDFQKQL